ncbi:MAG: hypothetical protein ABSH32_24970 [Bryobacteraceae bacterium]
MRRIVKMWLAVAAIVVMCHGLASAQALKLAATYIDAGFNGDGLSIPAGENTVVGPVVNITCPGTSGSCTVQADQFIQVGLGSATGNQFSATFLLDGTAILDGQIMCSTPSDGTYQVCSTSEYQTKVALGTHTVQISVSSKYGTYVFNYNTNFRVYK